MFSFSTCSASELFAIYVRKAGASKAKAVAHTIRREHSSRLPSHPRAQFTLLPETSPLASPRRWGRKSHSASLPFLGKPIPRFGAHHKADLRKREEDERDPRTKLRAAPTDQTLGVRRASPRREDGCLASPWCPRSRRRCSSIRLVEHVEEVILRLPQHARFKLQF